MKTRSTSTFKYHFRAPGSQVEGPIRFAVGQAVLGQVLVGRSPRGICAIFLGEKAQALRGQLEAFKEQHTQLMAAFRDSEKADKAVSRTKKD